MEIFYQPQKNGRNGKIVCGKEEGGWGRKAFSHKFLCNKQTGMWEQRKG